MINTLVHLLDDMILAAVPAIGFALLFNVPCRGLKYSAIFAACGHGLRTFLLHYEISLVFATFIAATIIGFLGVWVSHRHFADPKVITVAAIIPMFPGISAYKAMIALVEINYYGFSQKLIATMFLNLINTGFIIGALTLGLSLPMLLFYRYRPVV